MPEPKAVDEIGKEVASNNYVIFSSFYFAMCPKKQITKFIKNKTDFMS